MASMTNESRLQSANYISSDAKVGEFGPIEVNRSEREKTRRGRNVVYIPNEILRYFGLKYGMKERLNEPVS